MRRHRSFGISSSRSADIPRSSPARKSCRRMHQERYSRSANSLIHTRQPVYWDSAPQVFTRSHHLAHCLCLAESSHRRLTSAPAKGHDSAVDQLQPRLYTFRRLSLALHMRFPASVTKPDTLVPLLVSNATAPIVRSVEIDDFRTCQERRVRCPASVFC